MKKVSHPTTLSGLVMLAFIVPQIAFAAWWNPLSWNIFQGNNAKTQTLETPSNELESKIGNNASSTVSENKENTQKLTNETHQSPNASWWNPFSWNIPRKSAETSEIEKLRNEVEELKKKTNTPVVTPSKLSTSPSGVSKSATQSTAPSAKLSNSQIIAKVKPATVYIATENGSGSGVIFTTDGYVLTNDHVVKGVTEANVSLSTGEVIYGTVIGRNEVVDLAVIKLNTTKQLPKIDFGDSDKIQQGDEVFTFGFPFGIEGDVSFKEGTISRRIEAYFETSAEIHPGNSGGPLVNRYGQVIGINTAIFGKSISGIQLGETIKLAIPINNARNLIPDLKAGKVFIDEKARAREAEEKSRMEEARKEAERVAAETRAKEAEAKRKIDEENKRLKAEILVTQQLIQQKRALLAEYNTKKLNLEKQISDRKAKYYADYAALTESFRGRAVTASGVQWQYDALLREANKEIDLLSIELENLRIEYLNKINQL